MKINLKARLRSGVFWSGLIGAGLYFAKTSFGVDLDDGTTNTIVNLALMILAAVGVTGDPTTAGIGDSAQALTYDKPKKEDAE